MIYRICLVKVNSPIDENTFQCLLKFVQPEKQGRILKQKIKQNADNMLVGGPLMDIHFLAPFYRQLNVIRDVPVFATFLGWLGCAILSRNFVDDNFT